MKHGPIALVDEDLPVVVIAPKDALVRKDDQPDRAGKARGSGHCCCHGRRRAYTRPADEVLWVPEAPWLLSPILTSIPLQLFAYHIATQLGLDVDQLATWRNPSQSSKVLRFAGTLEFEVTKKIEESTMITKDQVLSALSVVIDPDLRRTLSPFE